jgi:hypothetical protein
MAYTRPVLLILLATSACTDLSAVRDYAKTASAVTENSAIFRQWPTAYDTSLELAGQPHVRGVYPQLHEQIRKEDAYAVGRSETAILATQALTLYLKTLGQLADDKLTDVSQQSADIKAGLGKLGVDPTGLAISEAISKLVGVILDAVRKRAISELIAKSNDDVKIITHYLATVAAKNVVKANEGAKSAAALYWQVASASTRDVGTRALLFRAQLIDEAAFAAPIAQARAAQAAFNKIGEDQEILYENRDRLKDAAVRDALLKDVPVLLDAIKSFQKP